VFLQVLARQDQRSGRHRHLAVLHGHRIVFAHHIGVVHLGIVHHAVMHLAVMHCAHAVIHVRQHVAGAVIDGFNATRVRRAHGVVRRGGACRLGHRR
jgi:hypothetical protein